MYIKSFKIATTIGKKDGVLYPYEINKIITPWRTMGTCPLNLEEQYLFLLQTGDIVVGRRYPVYDDNLDQHAHPTKVVHGVTAVAWSQLPEVIYS